jgi:predicted dehydrogenase
MGTGAIAGKFAEGLSAVPEAKLAAVGSRSAESALEFAGRFGVDRHYASYEALAADATVDVIYVATPHSVHRENTLLALNAGKHVLCEKPFAINGAEAREMVATAQRHGLFLMEAMWTRFFPLMAVLRQLLSQKVIGELRMATADFGYRTSFNAESRLFDPALGGGALLDVGVYPVSLAHMLFGTPSRIATIANLGQTGVDEQSAVILGYDGGQMVSLTAATRTETRQEAILLGTEGQIKLDAPWWMPSHMMVARSGKDAQRVAVPFEGNGYNYQAVEVMACIRAGSVQSKTMPWQESIAVMETLDRIRANWGLTYPSEREAS